MRSEPERIESMTNDMDFGGGIYVTYHYNDGDHEVNDRLSESLCHGTYHYAARSDEGNRYGSNGNL